MDDYNFWADLLNKFQFFSDWIKALCLVLPPGFLLAALTIVLHHRRKREAMLQPPIELSPLPLDPVTEMTLLEKSEMVRLALRGLQDMANKRLN